MALPRLLDGLCSLLLLPCRRRRSRGPRIVIIRGSASRTAEVDRATGPAEATSAPRPDAAAPVTTIRLATFNAAMFSMAAAVPPADSNDNDSRRGLAKGGSGRRRPKKGILKAQSRASPSRQQLRPRRVSINLQDDEIAAERTQRSPRDHVNGGGNWKGKAVVVEKGSVRTSAAAASRLPEWIRKSSSGRTRSVAEVLREVGADIVALQNVRAEQERGMWPLAELAEGLGMRYVFAESWAPEYGNAVLSRWPIKRWKVHRIADQSDFRNVLRVTVDVPGAGEVNFHCTHLDHLDENLRMKQVDSILRSADGHHILAGGLNALDSTDYSADRWAALVKYYGVIGKPAPKAAVMRHLKAKRYVDAKDFAALECETVVVVAKGQDVQGTCKYGTRVDYILASPNSPYKFVPGSYAVVSSKGTSDHHIVKADITVGCSAGAASRGRKQRVVRMSDGSTKGIWAAAA